MTRYRGMHEDLNLRAGADPDGKLEAGWRFGAAGLCNRRDKSKNKHTTKHP